MTTTDFKWEDCIIPTTDGQPLSRQEFKARSLANAFFLDTLKSHTTCWKMGVMPQLNCLDNIKQDWKRWINENTTPTKLDFTNIKFCNRQNTIFDVLHNHEKKLDFSNMIFYCAVVLRQTTCKVPISFHNSKIHGMFKVEDTTFEENAWFDNTEFKSDVVMQTVTFKKKCVFLRGKYDEGVYMNTISFQKGAMFRGCQFSGEYDCQNITWGDYLMFSDCKFNGDVNFNNIKKTNKTNQKSIFDLSDIEAKKRFYLKDITCDCLSHVCATFRHLDINDIETVEPIVQGALKVDEFYPPRKIRLKRIESDKNIHSKGGKKRHAKTNNIKEKFVKPLFLNEAKGKSMKQKSEWIRSKLFIIEKTEDEKVAIKKAYNYSTQDIKDLEEFFKEPRASLIYTWCQKINKENKTS